METANTVFVASPAPQLVLHLSYPKAAFTLHRLVYIGKDPWRSSSPTPSSKQVQLDQFAQGLVWEIEDSVLKHWKNRETFQVNHIEK